LPAAIDLIVGLGNPGVQYARTRHNAGFWLVDGLAAQTGAIFTAEPRYHGDTASVALGGHPCRLLKPTTFMNRSGQAVAGLSRYFRIPPERILVVHDEIDLPPGTVRLKQGGGHGGHNGLRDIIGNLGNAAFWRLRLGVGRPADRDAVVDYVLQVPPESERALILQALAAALELMPRIVAGEWQATMQVLHGARGPQQI
jgi:PTH1 family peptidyl-tRNA hydrolase